MSLEFWFPFVLGLLSGVFTSVVAGLIFEFTSRWQAHQNAKVFVGQWTAHALEGRSLSRSPMAGAGPTQVSLRNRWYSKQSGVLYFESVDSGSGGQRRYHDGHIVLDPWVPWLASRFDRYRDSNEVAQQQLVLSKDNSVIYVFPRPDRSTLGNVYTAHAWVKAVKD